MNTYTPQSRIPLLLCLLLALPAALPLRAQQAEALAADAPVIAIVPQEGLNLRIDEQITPTYVTVRIPPPTHNWFAGTFTNLPVGTPITIGLSLAGNGQENMPADVGKWVGLRPVFSYSDPTRYASYEWFVKEADGRWVSGDPLKTGEARYAGAGMTPEQSVVPDELAPQFLSTDGAYWSPWREVDDTEVLTNINVFRIRQTFALPTATVAMRVPYTYTYLQALVERLKAAELPGVFVDEIGATPEGRKLQIIRVTDPNAQDADQHAILVIAREHADEPAGSWVAQGLLRTLLSEEGQPYRTQRTWLILPIEDVDGSAHADYQALTDRFYKRSVTPVEVAAYTRYLTGFIAAGGQLDLAVSLHNVEANESKNLFCPILNRTTVQETITFNTDFFAKARALGLETGDPTRPWYIGFLPLRLYGWCARLFGAFDLMYEVNDRYPACRLTLAQLDEFGRLFTEQLAGWQHSDIGRQWHEKVTARLAQHRRERSDYFAQQQRSPERRTLHEIINKGY